MLAIPSRYFKVHLAKAIGIASTGGGIGGFVLPPLIEYIAEIYGLSGTFLLLSGFVLNLCVFTCMIIDPADYHPTSDANNENKRGGQKNGEINDAIEMNEQVYLENECKNGHTVPHPDAKDNRQIWHAEKSKGFVNKAMELDEVYRSSESFDSDFNQHISNESKVPQTKNTETLEENRHNNVNDGERRLKSIRCCVIPLPKKPIKTFLKEDFAIIKNKYCLSIGFAYIPLKISLSLSSIVFPDIAVGLGFSLAQGAMLISIIASMDILSRLINGFFLDTKLVSFGFTFGCPLFCLGLCLISMGILEKTASYASMAIVSAVFGFMYGMTLLHFPVTTDHYLGSKNVPTVLSFASFLVILPTFASSPLIDYFLKHFGQYANILYINGALYILSSIFWLVTGVKETRLRNTLKDSNLKTDNSV